MRRRMPASLTMHSELNLVPYLDVVTNLVMFMLISMTGFIAYQSLEAGLASAVSDLKSHVTSPAPELNIAIRETGFVLRVEASELPLVPVAAAGQQNFHALGEVAAKIKDVFPAATHVRINAERGIPYDAAVQTMDAVRGTTAAPLFPIIAFAEPPGQPGVAR
jgi:biopolymer transport protein ExbD